MELESAQEWSYYPRKKTRGRIEDKGTHFYVSLDIGRIDHSEPHTNISELKANSVDQRYFFKLLKSRNAGSSTSMNRSGHFATYNYRGYILLQSQSPIKSSSFKELRVTPSGKLIHVSNAGAQYKGDQIIINAPFIKKLIYRSVGLDIFLETGFPSTSSMDGVTVQQSDSIVLKYKTSKTIDQMFSDFSKIRNLLMLSSYFENDFNDVSIELIPSKLNRDRSNTVLVVSKQYRKIAIESENQPTPPHSWLFDCFMSDPEKISANYFTLLKDTDLQTSIDHYLAIFLPAKQNGVIEQYFMYSVLIIESLYERFIENFEDETKRKLIKLKDCKECGHKFCDFCAPISHVSLDTKLKRVVDKYLKNTGSEDYFKDLDFVKIAATRNHITHVKIAGKKELLEYGEMLDVANKFEYLFIYGVLQSIGYKDEDLDKILPSMDAFYSLGRYGFKPSAN